MDQFAPHELGVVLLSTSFLAALMVGVIAGWIGGMMVGTGAGALVVAAMSLTAAWITWQAGDQPERGMVRVEGTVAVDAESDRFTPGTERLTNHELEIRYTDENGRQHRLSGAYAHESLAPGQAVKIDYPAGKPDRATVVDPGRHGTILMVFLLFGGVPLFMSFVAFAAAWEGRPGASPGPAPRPAGVLKVCSWARVPANLALVWGFALLVYEDGLASFVAGFPWIGGGTFAHAAIALVAGTRLSGVLTLVVVGAALVGFAFLARTGIA